MSLRNNGTRLSMLTRDLTNKWHETKDSWKDAKSLEFEHKYIEELQAAVDTALVVIDQLDKLVAKIRKDCE
jgi:tRNA uridine 5-carbamoylmethylation protein Kti12